jgi:hypothetical protein
LQAVVTFTVHQKIDLKLIQQQLWPQALISPDAEAI